MSVSRLLRCVFLLALCAFNSTYVVANEALNVEATELRLIEKQKMIELISQQLSENTFNKAGLLELRQTLRTIRTELQKMVDVIQPVNKSVLADLTDLGPAPDEGELPEPDNIQKLRAELTKESLVIEGLLTQAEALTSKSSRLLENITSLRRSQFLDRLFERQMTVFNTDLWKAAEEPFYTQFSNYKHTFENKDLGQLIVISSVVFLVVFLIAALVSKKRLVRKLQNDEGEHTFSLISASFVTPFLAIGLGLIVIYQICIAQGIVTENNQALIQKMLMLTGFLSIVYLMTERFFKATLIRSHSRYLICVVALLFSVDALLLESGEIIGVPIELSVFQSYFVTSIFALMVGLFSFFVLIGPKEVKDYFFPRKIFVLFLAFSLFIILCNIFGYAALSRYIFESFVLIFSLLVSILVIRAVIRPYFYKIDGWLAQNKTDKKSEQLVFFWLCLSFDIILFFICLPFLAGIFGTEWQYIQDTMKQAFFGFNVGNMTISIANIGAGLLVFLVLLFVTRVIQRILDQKILPKTNMDTSVRQSITQVLGYVGLIIALMASISTVGFDLTNLALIAGALSVGIGFGLQSIVSNFVSGLILLFERPIKVGDWLITNSGEGIVKKISVRATVVETFDRTSIIVPNAELISSSVKNWTHDDRIGRVIINVGVSYSSDPQQVRDILMDVINQDVDIIKNPKPVVYFKDFADSALIFDVRFFIWNIQDMYAISSKVRFSIWDAFKDAEIEISFPQRDLHIRTAPGLEGILDGK
mgnify:CR=1 FL=1